jgi:hypothetical protein
MPPRGAVDSQWYMESRKHNWAPARSAVTGTG